MHFPTLSHLPQPSYYHIQFLFSHHTTADQYHFFFTAVPSSYPHTTLVPLLLHLYFHQQEDYISTTHTLPHHITNNTYFIKTSYTILASFTSTTRSTFSHHHHHYHHPPLQNKRAHLAKRLNSSAWERHHRLGHKSRPPVHTRAFLLHVMARKIELNGLFKRRGEAKRCREQWRMWE